MTLLYLASKSPRRVSLLRQVGIAFKQIDSQIDESRLPEETALTYVRRMAETKGRVAADSVTEENLTRSQEGVVLSADTIVSIDDEVFGKPESSVHAIKMLTRLSANHHTVITAVCVTPLSAHDEPQRTIVCCTDVVFRQLEYVEVEAYWETGEPVDKAGAYAIQGIGSMFIERINGSYSNVVGLPLMETVSLLKGVGVNNALSKKSH